MRTSGGHVFVVQGDLRQLACDAWLLPTDRRFRITPSFSAVDGVVDGRAANQHDWEPGERARRLPQPVGAPAVWLGHVGRSGVDAAWHVGAVRSFVTEAAAVLQDGRLTHGRPPLLAINHVGTGYGGAAFTKGELLTELFTTVTQLAEQHDVDIAVVSFDHRAYAAAQRARLRVLGGDGADAMERAASGWRFETPDRTSALQATARHLAERIDKRALALFMGAGVSAGAGLPGWKQLLYDLGGRLEPRVTKAQLDSLPDDRDRAAFLERRFRASRRSLGGELKQVLTQRHHSLQHGLLASMDVEEITTTNFDELFELAACTGDRRLDVIPSRRDPLASRWLLKLHGTLSEPDDLVFTRAEFLDAPRRRGALLGLVQAMLMTRHMLFVGYGLGDEDFHDLVHEIRYALGPSDSSLALGTALTLFEEPVRAELWSGDLDVVHMRSAPEGGEAPSDDDVALAARDIERFLDLVGMLSADRWAFILDRDYAGMRTEAERELAAVLEQVRRSVDPRDTRDGWRLVAELLRRLGA